MRCHLKNRIRTKSDYVLRGRYQADYFYKTRLVTSYPPSYKDCKLGAFQEFEDEVLELKDPVPSSACLRANSEKRLFKQCYNKKGEVDVDYFHTDFTVDRVGTYYNYKISMDSTWWWGSRTPSSFVPSLNKEEPNVDLIKLYQTIADLEPSYEMYLDGVNLWSIILELGQAKELLNLFAIDVVKSSLTSTIAEKHLGYSFGVVPMQKDIYVLSQIFERLDGVIDKWNKLADDRELLNFHSYVDFAELSEVGQPIVPVKSPVSSDAQTTGTYTMDSKAVSKVHIYGYARRIPDSLRWKVFTRALGLDKPITGAWEAMPFSWAVDYVLNIGDMINTWEKGLDSLFTFVPVQCGYSVYTKFQLSVELSDAYKEGKTLSGQIIRTGGRETGNIYKRRRLPHRNLFADANARLSNDMIASMNAGWKQATYVGAVALLLKRG